MIQQERGKKNFGGYRNNVIAKRKEADLQDSTPLEIENVEVVECGEAIVAAEKFVVVEEIIDTPKSIITLDNNEFEEIEMEDGAGASFNEENMEDELNLNFTNHNKSYFIFVNVQDQEYSFHKNTYVLFQQIPMMIHEDKCVARVIISNFNKITRTNLF